MLRDITDGLRAYGDAFSYLGRERVWVYALIPGLIGIVFSLLAVWSIIHFSDNLGDWLLGWYRWEFGRQLIESISGFVGGFLAAVATIFAFKYIVLIVSAPFMSPLSEKIEKIAYGRDSTVRFSIPQMLSDLSRGIRINLRNIIREVFLTLFLLILSLFPVFTWLTPILIFLVGAYYAGFGNMDYTLERYFGVRSSVRFVRQYRGLAMANGAVFVFLLSIPVIGVFVAVPLSTIAATLETVRRVPEGGGFRCLGV